MKRWERVAFDASAEDTGITIIRITRGTKGDAMANVEAPQWFEPDGHEYTGYAAATESGRRRAGDVIAEYRKARAVIAIEDETMWDPKWGELGPTKS